MALRPKVKLAEPDPTDVAFWEEAYRKGEYKDHWEFKDATPELVTLLATGLVPCGGVALDVGCGTGNEAIYLARCGLTAIGVDVSERALAIARKRSRAAGVAVDWRQGSVFALPVKDASVDLVNDRGVLHVLEAKHWSRYAAEIARVLKRGGVLLVRGSDGTGRDGSFTGITERSIGRHFRAPAFRRGPVLPMQLVSDLGTMDGAIVMVRKS